MANDMNIEIGVKLNDGGSGKKIGDIKDNLKQADTAAKSLKGQLREVTNQLNSMADAGETNSAEFRKLQAEAGRLKDQIGDTAAEIDAMAGSTVERLGKGLGKALKVGLAGFQAIEGSMAMFGVDSEAAQQAMAKLQGAMALSAAITEFGQLGDTLAVLKGSFSGLLAPIQAFIFGTETAAVAEGELAASTGVASVAMNVFRAALIATGIGAIIVAIGLLIANFDLVAEAVMKVSEYVIKAYDYFDNLGTGIKVLISIFFPFIGIIYAAIKALEYFGVIDNKSERDRKARHEKHMKRIDAELKKQEEIRLAKEKAFNKEQLQSQMAIDLAKAEGKETTQMEINKIQASINYQKEKQKELRQEYAAIKLLSETNKFYKDYFGGEKMAELSKGLDELDLSIANSENNIKILKAEAKKTSTGGKDDTKDELEKAKQAILDAQKATRDSKKTELQKSIDDVKDYYSEQIKMAIKFGLDTKALEEERDRQINKLRKDDAEGVVKLETKKATDIIKIISDGSVAVLENTKETNDARRESEIQLKNDTIVAEQELTDAKLGLATELVSGLESLSERHKGLATALFLIDKAMAVASVFINLQRQVSALRAAMATAEIAASLGGPAAAAAAAAPYVAQIQTARINAAASLATIAATTLGKFMGTGGGGNDAPNPGGGGGGGNNGSFTPSTFYGLGQTTPSNTNMGGGNNKVYVLESDITKTQRRVSVIERRSTLGA